MKPMMMVEPEYRKKNADPAASSKSVMMNTPAKPTYLVGEIHKHVEEKKVGDLPRAFFGVGNVV